MILLLLFTTFLTFLIVRQFQKAKRLPPGPTSLPLIGNIHQLVYYAWKNEGIVPAFEYFRKKYGDVFTLWLGPLPHVSICDFETSQEVFVKNGNKYKDRFLPPIFEHISEFGKKPRKRECERSEGEKEKSETKRVCIIARSSTPWLKFIFSGGLGLVASNGEMWAEMRRFTLLAFRNMGVRRDLMEEKIMNELDARCAELDSNMVDGKAIVLISEFFDLTVGSVINSLLVGKRFDEHNKEEFLQIKHLMDTAGETFSILDLTLPVWVLKTFFPRRYKISVAAQQNVVDFVSREAMKRAEDVKTGNHVMNYEDPQDFVDAFLIKMEKENSNGGHPAYTLKSLQHTLSDLWFAGQDTTSTTLSWGYNLFVNHPEVVKKVREELLRVTDNGARSLSLQDRSKTHYLNATIMEIQRYASILTVNFWRINHEATTINGHPLDAGTIITAQLGALHVNEDIFKNPEIFNPDRFIENDKLLSQVIPFGIGKRSCIGEGIAKAALYLVFGNLLLRYEARPIGSLPSLDNQLAYSAGSVPDKTVKLEFVKLL